MDPRQQLQTSTPWRLKQRVDHEHARHAVILQLHMASSFPQPSAGPTTLRRRPLSCTVWALVELQAISTLVFVFFCTSRSFSNKHISLLYAERKNKTSANTLRELLFPRRPLPRSLPDPWDKMGLLNQDTVDIWGLTILCCGGGGSCLFTAGFLAPLEAAATPSPSGDKGTSLQTLPNVPWGDSTSPQVEDHWSREKTF